MADLYDVRSKVSGDVRNMILAEMRATGRSESEILRDLIEPHFRRRIHAAKVYRALSRGEGDSGTERETAS